MGATDGGYNEALREADALHDSLDELLRLLDDAPLEALLDPHGSG
jgi:hypothetical protein